MAHPKTYIHGQGPGIGEFVNAIANAGITGLWKALDNPGFAAEAANIAQVAGVPQHVIMRWTEPGGVPDGQNEWYMLNPDDAADVYWERMMGMWAAAPELHPHKANVWLEIGNELETQVKLDNPHWGGLHPVEWLGRWGQGIATRAINGGFKALLFGMNSGTPEPEDWLLPGMEAFLRLCTAYPDHLGISLHEGYGLARFEDFDNIEDAFWVDAETGNKVYVYPNVTGRFAWLTDVANTLDITPPTIALTEWAWSYDHMPGHERALQDADFIGRVMNEFPNVLGSCFWNIDPQSSTGPVAQQMANFRPALQAFIIATQYEDPDPDPPPEPPADTFPAHMWQVHLDNHVMDLNADAALQQAIFQDGVVPVSPEWRTDYDGVAYAGQGAESLDGSKLPRVYYTEVGNWGDVRWLNQPGVEPEPPPVLIADRFDSPVGTAAERASLTGMWPGQWYWSLGFNVLYTNESTGNEAYHTGHDLNLPGDADAHKPLYAPANGVVTFADVRPVWGRILVIRHTLPSGAVVYSRQAHCESLLVNAGDMVVRGQQVGTVGQDALGGSFHLHFDIGITDAMLINPGDWPGLDRERLLRDYTNPRLFVDAHRPAPSQSDPALGLHAAADVGPAMPAEDFDNFRAANVGAIKVLAAHRPEDVARLRAENPDAGLWVVRAFLDWGGRNVTPAQFVEWTLGDVQRTVGEIGDREIWVELHNEPNLNVEGLGLSWADGFQFAEWLVPVVDAYRQGLPANCRLLYPGLSPGGDVPGIRQGHQQFFQESIGVLEILDGTGGHCYWQDEAGMTSEGLAVVDWYRSETTKPIIITEASNKAIAPDAVKAGQYVSFVEQLRTRAGILGVTYYVASASNPAFAEEVWAGTGIAGLVGQR